MLSGNIVTVNLSHSGSRWAVSLPWQPADRDHTAWEALTSRSGASLEWGGGGGKKHRAEERKGREKLVRRGDEGSAGMETKCVKENKFGGNAAAKECRGKGKEAGVPSLMQPRDYAQGCFKAVDQSQVWCSRWWQHCLHRRKPKCMIYGSAFMFICIDLSCVGTLSAQWPEYKRHSLVWDCVQVNGYRSYPQSERCQQQ